MALLDKNEICRLLAGNTLELDVDGKSVRYRVEQKLRLSMPVRELLAFRLDPENRLLLFDGGKDRFWWLETLPDCPTDFPRRIKLPAGEYRRAMRELHTLERTHMEEAPRHGKAMVGFYELGNQIALLIESDGAVMGWSGKEMDPAQLTLWATGEVK